MAGGIISGGSSGSSSDINIIDTFNDFTFKPYVVLCLDRTSYLPITDQSKQSFVNSAYNGVIKNYNNGYGRIATSVSKYSIVSGTARYWQYHGLFYNQTYYNVSQTQFSTANQFAVSNGGMYMTGHIRQIKFNETSGKYEEYENPVFLDSISNSWHNGTLTVRWIIPTEGPITPSSGGIAAKDEDYEVANRYNSPQIDIEETYPNYGSHINIKANDTIVNERMLYVKDGNTMKRLTNVLVKSGSSWHTIAKYSPRTTLIN